MKREFSPSKTFQLLHPGNTVTSSEFKSGYYDVHLDNRNNFRVRLDDSFLFLFFSFLFSFFLLFLFFSSSPTLLPLHPPLALPLALLLFLFLFLSLFLFLFRMKNGVTSGSHMVQPSKKGIIARLQNEPEQEREMEEDEEEEEEGKKKGYRDTLEKAMRWDRIQRTVLRADGIPPEEHSKHLNKKARLLLV
jgi:hypothetical protein